MELANRRKYAKKPREAEGETGKEARKNEYQQIWLSDSTSWHRYIVNGW